ncbi:MAG: hypothetical protein AB1696_14330 [Planctomycetota bacterium]
MSEDKKQPWPASWPPFWRAALHVAIATGAGNFFRAVAKVSLVLCDRWFPIGKLSFSSQYLSFSLQLCVDDCIAPLLTVVVLVLLARPTRRAAVALLLAFSPVIVAIPNYFTPWADNLANFVNPFISALVGFPLAGLIFAAVSRNARGGVVVRGVAIGALLGVVGWEWMRASFIPAWYGIEYLLPGSQNLDDCTTAFAISVTGYVLHPLTYAVCAHMLMASVKKDSAKGEE